MKRFSQDGEKQQLQHADRNMEKIGHNERGALKNYVERIERLEEEKRTIADDIKDIYSEAKGTGFDVKIMRKIVVARRKDAKAREAEREIMDLYAEALGMGIFA